MAKINLFKYGLVIVSVSVVLGLLVGYSELSQGSSYIGGVIIGGGVALTTIIVNGIVKSGRGKWLLKEDETSPK